MNEHGHDAYRGLGYRRLIAWSARLDREWPFLTRTLADAPVRSVVDLGCGPGEHLARLHAEGWRTLGIDVSAEQIEAARAAHPGLEFVQGRIEDLALHTRERFGAMICLGNVLPSLEDDALDRLLPGIRARLHDDGVLLVQLLDYERILAGERRSIGPVFRPAPESADPGDETVFLRLFAPGDDDRHVRFTPITFTLSDDETTPVRVDSARTVRQRAWTLGELSARLASHGFDRVQIFGDLRGAPRSAAGADDLVIVARSARRPSSRSPEPQGG